MRRGRGGGDGRSVGASGRGDVIGKSSESQSVRSKTSYGDGRNERARNGRTAKSGKRRQKID